MSHRRCPSALRAFVSESGVVPRCCVLVCFWCVLGGIYAWKWRVFLLFARVCCSKGFRGVSGVPPGRVPFTLRVSGASPFFAARAQVCSEVRAGSLVWVQVCHLSVLDPYSGKGLFP